MRFEKRPGGIFSAVLGCIKSVIVSIKKQNSLS